MMKRIAITGSIGTGKSTFCSILNELGYHTLSADEEAKWAFKKQSSLYKSLSSLLQTHSITPSLVAQRIFEDQKLKKAVEDLIHPFVRKRFEEKELKLKKKEVPMIFYEIPLLFDPSIQTQFNFITVITCSKETQLQRLINRNAMNKKEALKRIDAVSPHFFKKIPFHFTINNESSIDQLKKEAKNMLEKIKLCS